MDLVCAVVISVPVILQEQFRCFALCFSSCGADGLLRQMIVTSQEMLLISDAKGSHIHLFVEMGFLCSAIFDILWTCPFQNAFKVFFVNADDVHVLRMAR